MGGKSQFFNSLEYPFPRPLIEVCGKPIIELVIENLRGIREELQYVFVVNEGDCLQYHIDNTLNLLTDDKCQVVRIKGETKGSVCSSLLGIEYINNDDPLVVANSDQIIEEDLDKIMEFFRSKNADAGVICFESVHPRWSYAKINEEGRIIETAEKRPISKNAIAGFYFFNRGRDFVRAAMQSIKKEHKVNGQYYIAPVMNELILENRILVAYKIDNSKYYTFYSPQKIKEYERKKLNSQRMHSLMKAHNV